MMFEIEISKYCTELKLPPEISRGFLGFCTDYAAACLKAGIDPNQYLPTFHTFVAAVKQQLKHPYQFQPYHKRLLTAVDYYTLGLDFIRPLIDFGHSKVLGKEH